MKLDLVSKTGREHILLIDVLRGVAIAGVFLFHTLAAAYGRYHFPWNGWFPQFQSVNSYLLLWPFNFGYVGVAIFFVVSGFCIHLSYLSNQNQSWIFFFKKRILRIYPLYLLALLFFFVGPIQMYPLRSGTEWWQFLSHVFAVHNFGSETYAGINPSFWSIAVEVQLYLIYPLLLALVRKIGWEKTLIATMVLELFIRGTMMISDISSAIILPQVITASPLTFWFSWALGAYVSDCYKNSRASVINKINFSWVVVLSFLSAYCRPLTQFTFTLVAVSTAIFLNNQLEKKSNMPKGMLVKALEEHFSLLGLFSYGFYLFHQPLVAQSYSLMGFLFPQNFIPSFLMFWIMLLWYPLILISSSFMFKFVEKPMSQLGC